MSIEKQEQSEIGAAYLRDRSLSAAARGVLATLLSLPRYEVNSIEGLTRLLPNRRGAISTALSELEKGGYLKREMEKGADGRFKWYYRISAEPVFGGNV